MPEAVGQVAWQSLLRGMSFVAVLVLGAWQLVLGAWPWQLLAITFGFI